MNLRKRVFALLMSLAMVLTYMPGLAFAAEVDTAADAETPAVTEVQEDVAEEQPTEEAAPEEPAAEEQAVTVEEPAPATEPSSKEDIDVQNVVLSEKVTLSGDVTTVKSEVNVADSDTLLMDYFDNAFQSESGISDANRSLRKAANKTRRASLDAIDGNIYDILISSIDSFINTTDYNQTIETVYSINIEEMLGKSFNKTIVNGNEEVYEIPNDDFDSFQSFNHSAILNALLFDHPYKLFWFDKTLGLENEMPGVSYYDLGDSKGFAELPVYTFSFYVSKDYSSSGESRTYELDSSKLARVNMAAQRAAQISTTGASYGNALEALDYFRSEICEMTDYDHNAVKNNQEYGDPWQLINVFDNDPSSMVVCEGYSKAFQYLCDNCKVLSDSGIECDSVTGTMEGGTGAGAHMWNILHMNDGKNYIADITNCDGEEGASTVSVGYPDKLFLKGCMPGGSVESGYDYDCDGDGESDINYIYTSTYIEDGVEKTDTTTLDTFSDDELEMSETAYDPNFQPDEPGDQLEFELIGEDNVLYPDSTIRFRLPDAAEIPEGVSVDDIDIRIGINDGNYADEETHGWIADYDFTKGTEYTFEYDEEYGDIVLTLYGDKVYEKIGDEYNTITMFAGLVDTEDYTGWIVSGTCSFNSNGGGGDTTIEADHIEFIRANEMDHYEFYEELNGEIQNDEEGSYFKYNDPYFKEGDRLIIYESAEDTSGKEFVYVDAEEEYYFYCSDSQEYIDNGEVILNTNQSYINQWKKDKPADAEYLVTISYGGVSCSIPAVVVDAPFDSIELTRDGKTNQVEVIKGWDSRTERTWIEDESGNEKEVEFDNYSLDFNEGDIVTLKKGTQTFVAYEVKYITKQGWEDEFLAFVNQEDPSDILNLYGDIRFTDDEQTYENRWEVNGVYNVNLYYMGITTPIRVTVRSNPIDSVKLVDADGNNKSFEIYENFNTYTICEDGNPAKEYIYYRFPGFDAGDQILVDIDGTIITYTFDADDGWYFINDKDSADIIDFEPSDNQSYTNQWKVGGTGYKYTLYYKGFDINIPVTIVESPVASLRFTDKDGNDKSFTLVENCGGETSYDEDTGEFYRYYFPEFNDGDKMHVELKDGKTVDYTFENNEFAFVNDADNADIVNVDRDFYITSNQDEVAWKVDKPADAEYYFEINYKGYSVHLPAKIVSNPVESISFNRGNDENNPIELMDGLDGFYETDNSGDEYFCYEFEFRPGDVLTVTNKDGNSTEYTAVPYSEDSEHVDYFADEDGNKINRNSFGFDDDQYENHWTPGNDVYHFTLEYMGATTSVYVRIVSNPIDSISFSREGVAEGEFIELMEREDGYMHEGSFYYEFDFVEGDVLHVEYSDSDKSPADYKYHEGNYDGEYNRGFVNTADPNDYLLLHKDIYLDDDQHRGEWGPGENHEFTLEYNGRTADIPVTIVESPVDHIEFVRPGHTGAFELTEFIDGYMSWHQEGDRGFIYYLPFNEEDELYVTYKDGNEYKYIAEPDENYYQEMKFVIDGNSQVQGVPTEITSEQISQDSDQDVRNLWGTDEDHIISIRYLGKSCDVDVRTKANPVKSISFSNYYTERDMPYPLVEGADSYSWTDDYGTVHKDYDFRFFEADTLTVNYSDGTTAEYVYSADYRDFCKKTADGDFDPNSTIDVECYSEGDSNNWKVGETHYFIISYKGVECRVETVIEENTAESIEFISASAPHLLSFELDGYYNNNKGYFEYWNPWFNQGDQVKVYYNDGSSEVFTYNLKGSEFVNENGARYEHSISMPSPQTSEWALGSSHDWTFTFMGCEAVMPVTIVENTLKSIAFTPATPWSIANGNTTEITDASGNKITGYAPLSFAEGDVITITFIDELLRDPTQYYFVDSDRYGEGGYFENENGGIITADSIEITHDQSSSNTWAAGSHNFTLNYFGKSCSIPVTITGGGQTDAEYVPAKAASCTEGGYDAHWKKDGKLYKDEACTVETTLEELATEPLGHAWDNGTVTTAPTCTKAGVRTFHCSRCDETRTEEIAIDPEAHDWGEWVTSVYPTCTSKGSETRICSHNPEHVDTREIPINPDAHTPGETVRENEVAATCTTAGSYDEVVYCKVCNKELSRKTVTVDALGHTWDEGTVTKEPTESEEGIRTYTCTRCKETKTETIPVLAHVHVMDHHAAVPATCEEDGTIEYWQCSKCSKFFTDEAGNNEITEDLTVAPALGHTPGELKIENNVEPTYTQQGSSDEVIRCTVCGEIISSEHRTFKPLREYAQDSLAEAETSNANAEAAEGSTDVMPARIAEVNAENALIDAFSAETAAQNELDALTAEGSAATPEEIAAAKSNLAEAKEAVAKACTTLAAAKKSAAKVAANRAASAQAAAQSAATSAQAEAYRQQAAAEAASAQAYARASQTAAANAATKAIEISAMGEEFADVANEAQTIADNAGTAASTASGSSNDAVASAAAAQSAVVAKAENERVAAEYAYNNGTVDPTLPKVSIKAPKKAKKAFTPKWKKLSKKNQKKITKIEYEYSMDPNFGSGNVFKTASKKSAGGKKHKVGSKMTYYVRAHTYVIRGGVKYVSPWSKVKKVKTK